MAESVGVLDRGRVAVITGGASGIGLAVAEHRQFWILTHDEMASAPVERMQRAAARIDLLLMGAG